MPRLEFTNRHLTHHSSCSKAQCWIITAAWRVIVVSLLPISIRLRHAATSASAATFGYSRHHAPFHGRVNRQDKRSVPAHVSRREITHRNCPGRESTAPSVKKKQGERPVRRPPSGTATWEGAGQAFSATTSQRQIAAGNRDSRTKPSPVWISLTPQAAPSNYQRAVQYLVVLQHTLIRAEFALHCERHSLGLGHGNDSGEAPPARLHQSQSGPPTTAGRPTAWLTQ